MFSLKHSCSWFAYRQNKFAFELRPLNISRLISVNTLSSLSVFYVLSRNVERRFDDSLQNIFPPVKRYMYEQFLRFDEEKGEPFTAIEGELY